MNAVRRFRERIPSPDTCRFFVSRGRAAFASHYGSLPRILLCPFQALWGESEQMLNSAWKVGIRDISDPGVPVPPTLPRDRYEPWLLSELKCKLSPGIDTQY